VVVARPVVARLVVGRLAVAQERGTQAVVAAPAGPEAV